MSHHASGPNFGFPRGDARLDMTDLYAFTKPGDPSKSIIVFNVHPSFRLDSPAPTTTEPFAPGALYEIKIDTNGNAVADICYSMQFVSSEDGKQAATVRRLQGKQVVGMGERGEVIVQQAPVSVGKEVLVTQVGDFRFFFGWRSDPFFFDVNGNFNHMQFTGDDFFKDKNICSIVLELPNSELGTNRVGIWARTVGKTDNGWVQADRGGRPLQAVFLPGEKKEDYLTGDPANDDRFLGVFAHELEHSGGYTPEDAKNVARKLLPDILYYDHREPVRYPHNGRTLTDDVVDLFFSIYANRNVTDKVGPHRDLLDEFPYLGPPHDQRPPEAPLSNTLQRTNITKYNYATVRGQKMFYREAGNKDAPTIVLLHGFPSSSHMFRDLIPKLSDRFHMIAPDYIGFGYSDAPNTKEFTYTFDNLAEHVEELLFGVLRLKKFSIYVQDYGAPIGYRIASKHPDVVDAIVVQNGNAYVEGIGEAFNPMKPFWADRNAETEKPVRGLLTKETTVFQYTHGAKDPQRISPDAYTFDQFFLDRPGNDAVQLDLLYNYQSNVALYEGWHDYFRTKQPRMLIVWGTNDPFFTVEGAKAYQRDIPGAELHLIDTGHFALEDSSDFIAERIRGFLR